MRPTVKGVDLFRGNVLIHFGNGEAAIFYPDFLYANRNSSGNRVISEADEPTEELTFPSQEQP
jgi:hypothetical protein